MNFESPQLGVAFYLAASPILLLSLCSLVALLFSVSKSFASVRTLEAFNFVALVLALSGSLIAWAMGVKSSFLSGSYILDGLSSYGQMMILSIALVCSFLFSKSAQRSAFFRGEIICIFHLALLGMLVMISADELISLFVGLELASIGIYALVGYITPNRLSKEGAVKYLVLGSYASAFLLFGMSLIYASCGSMSISTIMQRLASGGEYNQLWSKAGLILIACGFGFKLALAPFHLWAPDVYESSPTPLTAFMATAVKIMVIVVFIRFIPTSVFSLDKTLANFFAFVAIFSVLAGNILALVQSSMKRLLAYSSVAHAGYMAIALCAVSIDRANLAVSAVLFYLTAYTLVSLAAFTLIGWFENSQRTNVQIRDLGGIAHTHPWAAFAMATCMFTFAGIPPTSGFMGKLFLFNAALIEGLYAIVLFGLLGAVIGLYYYLRIIVTMYMNPADSKEEVDVATAEKGQPFSWLIVTLVGTALVVTILLGTVLPNRVIYLAKEISGSVTTLGKGH